MPTSEPRDPEPCPVCGDGDNVPASGYWRCPKCDAEWPDDDDGQPDEMTEWRDYDADC